MRKWEMKEGQHYLARLEGQVVTVRLDAIRRVMQPRRSGGWSAANAYRTVERYDVTVLGTQKLHSFNSAAPFVSLCPPK